MPKAQSLKVELNPSVLIWTIASSGWNEQELISKLNIGSKTFQGWKDGSVKPTIKQLEDLSRKTKRPLAAFFLPEPPKEVSLPKDFRMLPDKKDTFERKTIFAIRKARRLQAISYELATNLKDEIKPKIKRASISDSPTETALKYRKAYNLTVDTQQKFKDAYKLHNYLRDTLEEQNILSFQISMPIEDARGFALADKSPKIIVVNSQDSIEARIFTLLHEFGHILLGETGISLASLTTTDAIERWCNKFAASFLLPPELATEIFTENKATLTDHTTLTKLSRKYKVSKAMLLYNMTELRFITGNQFRAILERYTPKQKKETKQKGGSVPVDRKCLSEMGTKFVSQVANNIDKNFITYSDALSYLSVKSRNLDKVLSKARK
ncbi:MAG: ImmA/IrrE family metallo-endopeptidase [Nanoarchaeota archaeon]|nr:ImmA/IrrE family metallo-endopeptidase [Nanoarchaeota archaeon]